MKLSFFNTLSGTTEPFSPQKKGAVTMYSCGPTVYDYLTIGNLRAYVFADLLKRTLIHNGYEVNHTMNFTDFGHLTSDADDGEDKMLVALKREGKAFTLKNMREIADVYIEGFKEDAASLNIQPPTQYARASDYVNDQIAIIKTLEEKGYTYETSDGIYFDIAQFPAYGKLGNIDVQKLKEGARVEINPEKKHPADFALWKKGELGWDSHWGKGFPGWHIECVAMIFATLGKQIDIHTGGVDHIHTHHNGEIAQAEAATGKSPFVRFWMHNAFITIEGKRIGKSVGNAIRLAQLRERGYQADVYRYWLLTTHYRSPANFTFEALDGAKQALFRLKRHMFEEYNQNGGAVASSYKERFDAAMNDDLDTPKAVALIWELVKDDSVSPADKAATLKHFDTVLGIGLSDAREETARSLGVVSQEDLPKDVQKLIEEREAARAGKDWDEADRIREAINLKGYLLEDTPEGPRVTKI